jgi:hypothetical protein
LIRQVTVLCRREGAGLFLGFILLVKVGDAVANPLFRLFLKDSRIALSDFNWSMNLFGIVALGSLPRCSDPRSAVSSFGRWGGGPPFGGR